jgi:hypothetical protein
MLTTLFAVSVLCQDGSVVAPRFVLNFSADSTAIARLQSTMDGVALVKHISSEFVERSTTTGGVEKDLIADQFQVVQTQGYTNRGSTVIALSQKSSRSIAFRVKSDLPLGVQTDFESSQSYLIAFQNPKGNALSLPASTQTRPFLFVRPKSSDVAILWMMPCQQFVREATPLLTLLSSGINSIAYDPSIRRHEGFAHQRFSQLLLWPVNKEYGLQMGAEERQVLVDRARELLKRNKDPMRRLMIYRFLAVDLAETSYTRDHFNAYLDVAPTAEYGQSFAFMGPLNPSKNEYLNSDYVLSVVENRKDVAKLPYLEYLIDQRPRKKSHVLVFAQLLDSPLASIRETVLGRLALWANRPDLAPVVTKPGGVVVNEKELIQRWKTNPPLESWKQ